MVLAKGHDQWHHADRAAIAVPSAWLAKVVTNLCLNRLASARVQRELRRAVAAGAGVDIGRDAGTAGHC